MSGDPSEIVLAVFAARSLQSPHLDNRLSCCLRQQYFLGRPWHSHRANFLLALPEIQNQLLTCLSSLCGEALAHFPLAITILVIIRHQGISVSASLRFPFFPQCAITNRSTNGVLSVLITGC